MLSDSNEKTSYDVEDIEELPLRLAGSKKPIKNNRNPKYKLSLFTNSLEMFPEPYKRFKVDAHGKVHHGETKYSLNEFVVSQLNGAQGESTNSDDLAMLLPIMLHAVASEAFLFCVHAYFDRYPKVCCNGVPDYTLYKPDGSVELFCEDCLPCCDIDVVEHLRCNKAVCVQDTETLGYIPCTHGSVGDRIALLIRFLRDHELAPVDSNFQLESCLNGANGEATNSDDMLWMLMLFCWCNLLWAITDISYVIKSKVNTGDFMYETCASASLTIPTGSGARYLVYIDNACLVNAFDGGELITSLGNSFSTKDCGDYYNKVYDYFVAESVYYDEHISFAAMEHNYGTNRQQQYILEPCEANVVSTYPTFSPTALPTRNPTATPTVSPTLVPTATPSCEPSHSPTLNPTPSPSFFGMDGYSKYLQGSRNRSMHALNGNTKAKLLVIKEKGQNKKKKKGNKKQKKNQVEVVKSVSLKQSVSTAKRGGAIKSSMKMSVSANAFRVAMTNPFSEGAMGARIPAPFSCKSTTLHSKGRIVMKTDTNGNMDFVYMPGALVSFMSANMGLLTGIPMTYSQNFNFVGGLVTRSFFSTAYASYRSTGGGVRMKNLLPMTSPFGRIIVAKIPVTKNFFGVNALANVGMQYSNLLAKLTGAASLIDTTGYITPAILELPDSFEITNGDILTKAMELVSKVSSSAAMDLKGLQGPIGGNNLVDYEQVLVSSSGAINTSASDNEDDTKTVAGWHAILIRVEGMPANTNVLDIEYITHFEAIPAVSSNQTLVPDDMIKPDNTPGLFDRVVSMAERVPWARVVDLAATSYLGYNPLKMLTNG